MAAFLKLRQMFQEKKTQTVREVFKPTSRLPKSLGEKTKITVGLV